MIDLTKITTAFGLLDDETQQRLRNHPGPLQYYSGHDFWRTKNSSKSFFSLLVYRVEPTPPKPLELFIVLDQLGVRHEMLGSREAADRYVKNHSDLDLRVVHVREALE